MTQIKHTQICSPTPGYAYRNKHTRIRTLSLGHLTYSNGAVQIRVGLELAEAPSGNRLLRTLSDNPFFSCKTHSKGLLQGPL